MEEVNVEEECLKIEAYEENNENENLVRWRGVKGIGWGKGAHPMDPM